MTDSIYFLHLELTPIHGKPTAATIKQLKKEAYDNVRSVYSDRGGGMNGHLGIVMATAPYVLRAGQVFDIPNHRGPQVAHAAGVTQSQITAANRLYDTFIAEYAKYALVHKLLKQQILTAVKSIYYQDLEDDTFGYADVSIPDIRAHLTTQDGQLNAANLKLNRTRLTEQWSPDEPLEDLWKRTRIIRSVAVAGGNAITDGSTIELTLEDLRKAGVYDHAITMWYDKDETDHTWANFMLHFTKHEKERHRKLTARTAGFHGANLVKTPVTPEKIAALSPPQKRLLPRKAPPPSIVTTSCCTIVGPTVCHATLVTPVTLATTKLKTTKMLPRLTTARAVSIRLPSAVLAKPAK
jgi:hypothetical protein